MLIITSEHAAIKTDQFFTVTASWLDVVLRHVGSWHVWSLCSETQQKMLTKLKLTFTHP